METSLRIKVSELDMAIIERIKQLFGVNREITLTIESSNDFGLTETKEQYFQRLRKAIDNLENGRKVSLSEHELNELVLQQLKK
jgi:hypothetical protein